MPHLLTFLHRGLHTLRQAPPQWRYLVPVLTTTAVVVVLLTLLGSPTGRTLARQPVALAQAPQNNPCHINTPCLRTGQCARVAAVGDTGSGRRAQYAIGRALATQRQRTPFSHLVLLGDNIYPVGDIKRYRVSRFERPYKDLLKMPVTIVASLGNHDMPHQNDQLAYFNMPHPHYIKTVGPLSLVVIDTNTFPTDATQQAWAAEALSQNNPPWPVLVGHHPALSSGHHGSDPGMTTALNALSQKHPHPVLFLAGHDHHYERITSGNLTQIVSGGGGAPLRDIGPTPVAGSLKQLKAHHFLLLEASDTCLHLQALDEHNDVIDSAVWHKSTP
jgi:hypothetical protein